MKFVLCLSSASRPTWRGCRQTLSVLWGGGGRGNDKDEAEPHRRGSTLFGCNLEMLDADPPAFPNG